MKKLILSIFIITATARLSSQTLVKDFASGATPGLNQVQSTLVLNSNMYFTFGNSSSGTELYVSDGTGPGTSLIQDVNPGPSTGIPFGLRSFNNELYSVAQVNGVYSQTYSYACGSYICGGYSYCCSRDWLGRCRGTCYSYYYCTQYCNGVNNYSYFYSNQVRLTGTSLTSLSGNYWNTNSLINTTSPGDTLGGYLYFNASPLSSSGDNELYRVNLSGTPSPALVANINSGGSSTPGSFTSMGGKVFFRANDGTNGTELWSTDGSTTSMVKDINSGSAGSAPNVLTVFNGKLYFQADDGLNGMELWVSDGTAPGTNLLKDINTSGSSNPYNFIVSGNYLYFIATDGVNGNELWRTDGTPSGTIMLKDITPGSGGTIIAEMTPVSGMLLFTARSGTQDLVMYTDGSNNGTDTLFSGQAEISMMANNKVVQAVYNNGLLYFAAQKQSPYKGWELWVSDGTPNGTSVVTHFNGAAPDSIYQVLGVLGTDLMLRAADGLGSELYSFSLIPLSTTLLSFTGSNLGSANQLFWKIAAYHDVAAYRVEKLVGEDNWKPVGTVSLRQAHSETGGCFQLLDPEVYPGDHVYRLVEVGTDGNLMSISKTLVRVEKPKAEPLVYPNPAGEVLNVVVADGERAVVCDLYGRELGHLETSQQGSIISFRTAGLKPGMYMVKIVREDGSYQTVKFTR